MKRAPSEKVDWGHLIGQVSSERDREAFKCLFEYFAPRVKGFMNKAGCNPEEAEEIAQNTMVAVWRKADRFDPKTTGAAAWIFTIARNLRIDAMRRAMRSERAAHGLRAVEGIQWDVSADVIAAQREDGERVLTAIKLLSSEQSAVIRLSFLEERSHQDIASLLQIPLGTVKSRIRLAMNRLKDLLDDER